MQMLTSYIKIECLCRAQITIPATDVRQPIIMRCACGKTLEIDFRPVEIEEPQERVQPSRDVLDAYVLRNGQEAVA